MINGRRNVEEKKFFRCINLSSVSDSDFIPSRGIRFFKMCTLFEGKSCQQLETESKLNLWLNLDKLFVERHFIWMFS